MKRKTPTAPKREGGNIVRSGDRRVTSNSPKTQHAGPARVPAWAIPSLYASQLREAAERLDCVAGFEAYAAKNRRDADLIEWGHYCQGGVR